jgi:hypothetical protein
LLTLLQWFDKAAPGFQSKPKQSLQLPTGGPGTEGHADPRAGAGNGGAVAATPPSSRQNRKRGRRAPSPSPVRSAGALESPGGDGDDDLVHPHPGACSRVNRSDDVGTKMARRGVKRRLELVLSDVGDAHGDAQLLPTVTAREPSEREALFVSAAAASAGDLGGAEPEAPGQPVPVCTARSDFDARVRSRFEALQVDMTCAFRLCVAGPGPGDRIALLSDVVDLTSIVAIGRFLERCPEPDTGKVPLPVPQ